MFRRAVSAFSKRELEQAHEESAWHLHKGPLVAPCANCPHDLGFHGDHGCDALIPVPDGRPGEFRKCQCSGFSDAPTRKATATQ